MQSEREQNKEEEKRKKEKRREKSRGGRRKKEDKLRDVNLSRMEIKRSSIKVEEGGRIGKERK